MNSPIRCSEMKVFDKMNSMIYNNTLKYKSNKKCSIFKFKKSENILHNLSTMFIKEPELTLLSTQK